MDLSVEHPGYENWERKSREMMRIGRHHLNRRGSYIDVAHVRLRYKMKERKSTKPKTKTNKRKERRLKG
jgi:hypothetical protein